MKNKNVLLYFYFFTFSETRRQSNILVIENRSVVRGSMWMPVDVAKDVDKLSSFQCQKQMREHAITVMYDPQVRGLI